MNSLIEQLAIKSGFKKYYNDDGLYSPRMEGYDIDDDDDLQVELQEFAELIIKECKKVIDPSDDLCSMAEDIHRRACVKMIDKHFGVK